MSIRILSVLLALATVLGFATPARALTAQEQQELQIGDQVYRQLDRQGKILHQSQIYAVLTPIGQRIASAANAKYFMPFRFVLVHDKQPNAFCRSGRQCLRDGFNDDARAKQGRARGRAL